MDQPTIYSETVRETVKGRLAFGVWRSAFGVWRLAFGVRRWAGAALPPSSYGGQVGPKRPTSNAGRKRPPPTPHPQPLTRDFSLWLGRSTKLQPTIAR
jgi:hypothetical protein